MEQIATPIVFYRGGTSKAVFVDRRHLPITDEKDLDAWILAIYGSPDRRQIDGLGGADILTSKFAVVGPPTRPDADVDYTFYQVGIEEPKVSTDLNCGNISSAVGPYAIDQGFVKATGDWTTVRVHATNFDNMIYVTVPTHDGKPRILGDQQVQGVPGTGAPISVDFRDTVGTHGGKLLPTGNLRDRFQVDGVGEVEVSIVDLANLICFMKADRLGLDGTEGPDELMENKKVIEACEQIRLAVAVKLGLAKDIDDAKNKQLATPWLTLVSEPKDWTDYATGKPHKADECDFSARMTVQKMVHKTYPGTGSACTGVAAALNGTVLHDVCKQPEQEGEFRIGHPCGTLGVDIKIEQKSDKEVEIKQASLMRTARRLMDGQAFAAVDRLPWLKDANGTQHEAFASDLKKAKAEVAHAEFHGT